MNRLLCLLAVATLSVACIRDAGPSSPAYRSIRGETMGTYYNITYADSLERDLQPEIDELLRLLNLEVSTYIPQSTVSAFNRSEKGLPLDYNPADTGGGSYPNTYFLDNLELAREIYTFSGGAFDPTVMPLINYWGFGYTPKRAVAQIDSLRVDSLMAFVGLDKVVLEEKVLTKAAPGVQLDFSAVAKGYGVDRVGLLLEEKGIVHYLVEIGGEVRARGRNARGEWWRLGISTPSETAGLADIQVAVPLRDRAMATSGNYRNFYEVDGVKYGHTINPFTGFPEKNLLLSASVTAPDCATADALATAFMVLGPEKALALAEQKQHTEAYFILSDGKGGMTTLQTSGWETE